MKLAYRPEVDGLRAIAVLLVVIHHVWGGLLPGGYVGVDVFFVISGYLITGIVVAEIRARVFSFANFYKRRIVRLAPAYFLVILTTMVAATFLMLPAELLRLSKSVVYATAFLANVYMWNSVGGYFGVGSETTPLLHLWSLAVEEQFYLIWPASLIIAFRFLRGWWLTLFVLGATFLGLAVSVWGVENYLNASYYLLPTRFFELMMGAVLVFLPPCRSERFLPIWVPLAGLALIVVSAVGLSKGSPFPGWNAVYPCLGTALIIWASTSREGLGKVLSLRGPVEIGRISYPAYLWHWPIIAFLNLYEVPVGPGLGIAVIVATWALSAATHRYVEIPSRRLLGSTPRVVAFKGFAAPAATIVALVAVIVFGKGLPGRFPAETEAISSAILTLPSDVRGRCNEGNVRTPLREDDCVLGLRTRPVDFLLIGDSHANHFAGMVDVLAKDAGLRGYDITQSQTIFLPGVRRYEARGGTLVERRNFRERNEVLERMIAGRHFGSVILAGGFAYWYGGNGIFGRDGAASSREAFEAGFRAAIDRIERAGSRAVVIEGSPLLSGVDYDCPLRNSRFHRTEDCSFDAKVQTAAFREWSQFLSGVAIDHPRMMVIRVAPLMCDSKRCHAEIRGVPMYRDNSHLNQVGSELLGHLLIEKSGNPLKELRNDLNPVVPETRLSLPTE